MSVLRWRPVYLPHDPWFLLLVSVHLSKRFPIQTLQVHLDKGSLSPASSAWGSGRSAGNVLGQVGLYVGEATAWGLLQGVCCWPGAARRTSSLVPCWSTIIGCVLWWPRFSGRASCSAVGWGPGFASLLKLCHRTGFMVITAYGGIQNEAHLSVKLPGQTRALAWLCRQPCSKWGCGRGYCTSRVLWLGFLAGQGWGLYSAVGRTTDLIHG